MAKKGLRFKVFSGAYLDPQSKQNNGTSNNYLRFWAVISPSVEVQVVGNAGKVSNDEL